MFLVKINLPPIYSLRFSLMHPSSPIFHLLNTSLPFLYPSFSPPNPIDCILLHSWGGGGLRWMRKKDSEGNERLLLHLFCFTMGTIFPCMHFRLSAGTLPPKEVYLVVIACFPQVEVCLEVTEEEFHLQSFIPSLYHSRRE